MTVARLFRTRPPSPTPDADLLARFVADSDPAAFADLLARHGPLVYRVCRRLLGNSADVEDAFQATFLVLATRAASVRIPAGVGGWLLGVAGRVACQTRRKQRNELRHQNSDFFGTRSASDGVCVTTDLGWVLDEEFSKLPDKLRAVAVACLVKEQSQAETAAALGESERTVRRRVAEAKRRLRERLERRGVAPAVAFGLVASIVPASAVPVRLLEATKTVVFDFLAGGRAVASVPAILAKGVAMSGLRMKVAAAVVGAVIGLTTLSAGLADSPKREAEVPTIPPTVVPVDRRSLSPPAETHTVVVRGGDELVNRVVQREAEHLRRVLTVKWFGKPLSAPEQAWEITVKLTPDKPSGGRHLSFRQDASRPGVRTTRIGLIGSLEQILRVHLPHLVTRAVFAEHFARPLPSWVDEGFAVFAEPTSEQTGIDRHVRDVVATGRAIRVKHLLTMTEYPKDEMVLYSQGHSLVRFLHARDPKKLIPLIEAGLTDGWDKAMKATYGFADADVMEVAWLDWMKMPESVLPGPKAEAKSADRHLIEAPDILRLDTTPPLKSVRGEFLVRPDGTINLGEYGSVSVTGMSPAAAAEAIEKHLKGNRVETKVTVEVAENNSKAFYVVTDLGTAGEQVVRLPTTGNETVVDAIASIGGVVTEGRKVNVWIDRPTSNGGKNQILPVDWKDITEWGNTRTNYQLLPGDKLHVKAAK